jgi:uroporphyrinogen-III synthase
MQQFKPIILSTKSLDEELIRSAEAKGVSVDVLPFIKTETISTIETQQEIESALLESVTVVFTSVNAVEAVAAELHESGPAWQIFCIGHATFQLVEKYFGSELIAGTADNAEDLAEMIAEGSNSDEVTFFCGDRRRDELTDILKQNNIEVTEIVVYETVLIPHKIEKKYDGILFFSPSAVQSFFEKNKPDDQTVLFAIGNTTANEIKKYLSSDGVDLKNKIFISDEPVKETLLEKAITYFQTNKIHH